MASEDLSFSEDFDFGDLGGEILPYENEPLAPTGAESCAAEDDEDIDGLQAAVLDRRFERADGLKTWYTNFYYFIIPGNL